MNVISRKDKRKIPDADIKKVNFIAYLSTPSSKIKFGGMSKKGDEYIYS